MLHHLAALAPFFVGTEQVCDGSDPSFSPVYPAVISLFASRRSCLGVAE
jgi:hypothetical protein